MLKFRKGVCVLSESALRVHVIPVSLDEGFALIARHAFDQPRVDHREFIQRKVTDGIDAPLRTKQLCSLVGADYRGDEHQA